jgi:hypothetical protein
MTEHQAPPISPAYVRVDPLRWVNRYSGDIVVWNSDVRVYQLYRADLDQWSWWGGNSHGTQSWHPYPNPQVNQRATVDFWVFLLVGIGIFAWTVSSGFAGIGAIVLLLFVLAGLGMSHLHKKHPLLYTGIALLGYIDVPVAIHHHNQIGRANPLH